MAKMSAGDLKALLSAERYDALSAMAASKLSDERASALNYYMGNMSKDMPAPDGRSKAVSSDVADTIEGLMPPLMEIFASGDEVVQFAPVGPEDVAAAEQETDYVNHVFMQKNPGFLVLYSFIKDALLSKVGAVKVWWECRDEVERETYLDQPDDAFALIVSQPGVEIVEHSEREIPLSEPPSPFVPAQAGTQGPQAARRHHRDPPHARVRPRRRRDPGGVRHQPARTLDQGHGLLLPRRVPHRVAADRARLRPRAGQEAPLVHARAYDRGAGARHRQRIDPAAGRRRAQRLEPAHSHHRALRAHGLRRQRRGRALPLHHRRRGGRAPAARRR